MKKLSIGKMVKAGAIFAGIALTMTSCGGEKKRKRSSSLFEF